MLEKRRQRVAQLDAEVARMTSTNSGRVPAWDTERVMRMDQAALALGKRCIMWDDAGAGFFLVRSVVFPGLRKIQETSNLRNSPFLSLFTAPQMLNWDWVANRPAAPATTAEALSPGWWVNAKELLRPPLLDPTTPEDKLAAWIDKHTMRVHARLLERQGSVRRGGDAAHGAFVLDPADAYWAQLRALPPLKDGKSLNEETLI